MSSWNCLILREGPAFEHERAVIAVALPRALEALAVEHDGEGPSSSVKPVHIAVSSVWLPVAFVPSYWRSDVFNFIQPMPPFAFT